jgi:hypothetical protein
MTNKAAKRLVADLMDHHRDIVHDENVRDAVIVKSVALLVLAFDLPAMDGKPIDYDEAIRNLYSAVQIITKAQKATP